MRQRRSVGGGGARARCHGNGRSSTAWRSWERKEEDEKVALVRLVGLVGPVIYEESVSKGLLVYTSV
jgi:hypothetical protein